ncbi:MAG TPA: PQQ-dependent sugar dehydrogenase, partial [Gaiellaceae bacterium]|nr:PQQ-dependent sugar dehydrogenase [Gaiellaceae bacterium]
MAERRGGWGRGPELHALLAYATRPLYPLLRRVQIRRTGRVKHDPADILLPDGYVAELVATGFKTPIHCCFDDQGRCYVTEAGYKIESLPRILRVDTETGAFETLFELPRERWFQTGAMTGACWHAGSLYVANTDTLFRIGADGRVEDVVTGLPGRGDHQTNYPVVGPDGKLYFTVGTATNLGVVGPDNWNYEWLRHFPDVHDVPGQDVSLVGTNFDSIDVRAEGRDGLRVSTGAFSPFGTPTEPGQVIPGSVKCSGSVLRCNPDGSELELVAWGLRNPYGKAFAPDGRLYVTEHNVDERGHRMIFGDSEDLYEVREGAWYGWPDYAAGIRLDDPHWGRRGRGREPLLADPPDPNPPRPLATFEPHAAPNGLDFCLDPAFGFEGDAFVCLFGDLNPNTTRQATPTGYKIVRVDIKSGEVVDFAVNKIVGPASKLPHGGFERPSHCAFGPDGALYVVDWGEINIAPEVGGVRMGEGTGALWRIRRTSGAAGIRPARPREVPLYALLFLALPLAVAAAAVAAAR